LTLLRLLPFLLLRPRGTHLLSSHLFLLPSHLLLLLPHLLLPSHLVPLLLHPLLLLLPEWFHLDPLPTIANQITNDYH
jgi:hypothetical protein